MYDSKEYIVTFRLLELTIRFSGALEFVTRSYKRPEAVIRAGYPHGTFGASTVRSHMSNYKG